MKSTKKNCSKQLSIDFNIEVWKPVVGYEGFYEVSNIGRLKSVERKITYSNGAIHPVPETMMALHIDKKTGYVRAALSRNKKVKCIYLHRLVAEAFIGTIPKGMHINHINSVRTDNRVGNLEIVTVHENILHSMRFGNFYNNCRKVVQLSKDGKKIKEYASIKEASIHTDAFPTHISSVCNGSRKTAGGYKWKYA